MKMTNHRILIEDLGHLEREERRAIERRRTEFDSKEFDYENYQTFDDVIKLDNFALVTIINKFLNRF